MGPVAWGDLAPRKSGTFFFTRPGAGARSRHALLHVAAGCPETIRTGSHLKKPRHLGYREMVFPWAGVRTTLKPDGLPGSAPGSGAGLSRDAPSSQGTQCILNDGNNGVARHSAGGWQSFG